MRRTTLDPPAQCPPELNSPAPSRRPWQVQANSKKGTNRSKNVILAVVGVAIWSAILSTATGHFARLSCGGRGGIGGNDAAWSDAPASEKRSAAYRDPVAKKGDNNDDGGRDGEKKRYHVIFSTDCSGHQHWQSYALFHRAFKVGQLGHITRILSGCSDEETKAEVDWHNEHVKGRMSDRFRLHLTPQFGHKDYMYFNKPFGVRHWMEHGEGMGIDPKTGAPKDEDAIIFVLDPDHIILRPLVHDFSNESGIIFRDDSHRAAENRKMKVEHGTPFAQMYGVGDLWMSFNLTHIAGPDSPAKNVSRDEALRSYVAGPPYIATARDMYRIAVRWADMVHKVRDEFAGLISEMYAYIIAAADAMLPHRNVKSMMVSDASNFDEGWPLIDKLPAERIQDFASNLDYDKKHSLPNILHYCQKYKLGTENFFFKRHMPTNFFTCESPLLVDRNDLADSVNVTIDKRHLFMLRALTMTFNEGAQFFKMHACSEEGKTNWEKTLDLSKETSNNWKNSLMASLR